MFLPRSGTGAVFCLLVCVSGALSGGLRHFQGGRRYRGELGKAFEVLDGGGEEELILGACKASQPEALEAQVTLQVGKKHEEL